MSKNYSLDFYTETPLDVKASGTSTAAGTVNSSSVPVGDAAGFHFNVKATGGSALNATNYLIFKSIQFGNSDFSDNITTYDINSDYLLVKGSKSNVATSLKLAAVGNFEVGIPNFAINGQTNVRINVDVVGAGPNIVWEIALIKKETNITPNI